jgi:hypothetical protein
MDYFLIFLGTTLFIVRNCSLVNKNNYILIRFKLLLLNSQHNQHRSNE